MRIGDLNTPVEIHRKTRERDDLNKLPEKWEKYCEAWCSVEGGSGNESVQGQQNTGTQTWVFKTHWSLEVNAVTPAMRLVMNGKVLGIQSAVNEGMRNRIMIITCVETF